MMDGFNYVKFWTNSNHECYKRDKMSILYFIYIYVCIFVYLIFGDISIW